MTTMRDIAVRAGVSRSTVSFVLNDKHALIGLNEETRLRVLQAADELGYRRNELARGIVAGKISMFGFLVWAPMLDSEVAARVLNGVLDEAEANQHTVQVMRLSGDNDEEIIKRCVELRPAGVIGIYVDPAILTHLQEEMSRFNIPIALLDSTVPLPGTSRILSDDIAGCRLAIEHLTSLGHKRIAYIGGMTESVVSQLRKEGYQRAMHDQELTILPGYLEIGHWNSELTAEATQRLFRDLPVPPTAIFCADDKTAMVACRTLRQLGLSVPDQVSIVGFADLVMASYNDPPLTTVAQPFQEMGRKAVRRLLSASEEVYPEQEGDNYYEDRLSTTLMIRRSTAPPFNG